MTGVRDELLLCGQVAQIRRDGALGEQHDQRKHQQQTPARDGQRDKKQRPDALQLALGIEEQHDRLLLAGFHQIPVSALIAARFPAGERRVRVVFGICLRDRRNIVLIDLRDAAVRRAVHGEKAQRILHLRRKVHPVVKRRCAASIGKRRVHTFNFQQPIQRLVLLARDITVISDV